jgi:hypothetical protein
VSTALYCDGHAANCRLSAKGHLLSTLPYACLHNCVVLAGAEAAEVVPTTVEALALRVLVLVGEGPLLLTTALLGLSFLVQSVAA